MIGKSRLELSVTGSTSAFLTEYWEFTARQPYPCVISFNPGGSLGGDVENEATKRRKSSAPLQQRHGPGEDYAEWDKPGREFRLHAEPNEPNKQTK